MSSQPYFDTTNHHPDAHFDHVLAGLQHRRLNHRDRINELEQEREDLEIQRAALVREFQAHANIHAVPYQDIEGYEDKTYPVESQMETARHYRGGTVGGTVIAVILGAYFTYSTMMAESAPLLLLLAAAVAVFIGVVAFVILRALLDATSVRPRASKWLRATVVVTGGAFFALLTAFAWLRFQSDSPLAVHLPSLMVGMELTAIIFAGACHCGFTMFRWSGVFHERHRHLLHREGEIRDELANKHVDLMEVEHRIREHVEAHHNGHHTHAHAHSNGHASAHAGAHTSGHTNGHTNAPAGGHEEVRHEVRHHEAVHA